MKVLRGQKRYTWHKGALWAPRGVRGHQGVVRGCKGVLGAGRECRYSGARRDICDIRALGTPRGVVGVREHWGHKGASRGEGLSGVHWG